MQVNYFEYLGELRSNRIRCVICLNLMQTLHHIDENQKNNDTENLLKVCHKCHDKIKHIKKPKDYIPKKTGLTLDIIKPTLKYKKCPQCNKNFTGRRNKIFCSTHCRFKEWAKKHPRVKIENEN